jgi:hypothetical protein
MTSAFWLQFKVVSPHDTVAAVLVAKRVHGGRQSPARIVLLRGTIQCQFHAEEPAV